MRKPEATQPASNGSWTLPVFNARFSIRQQVLLILLIPLILSVAIALLVHQVMRNVQETESLAERSTESLIVSQRILVSILNVQTGTRGFVITGDERYLGPYVLALKEFSIAVQEARSQWADDPERLELIRVLERNFKRYQDEISELVIAMRQTVEVEGIDGYSESAAWPDMQLLVGEGTDKELVDQMKTLINRLMAEERQVLGGYLELTNRQRRIAMTAGIAGPLVAVLITALLLGALLARVSRGMRQLIAATSSVEEGNLSSRLKLSDNQELSALATGFNRMAGRLEQRSRHTILLDRLSRTFQNCRTTEEAYEVAEHYFPRILAGTVGAVYMYRPSRDLIEPKAIWGGGDEDVLCASFEPGQCWALRSGYTYHYQPNSVDLPCRHLTEQDTHHDALCIPMNSAEEVLGVLVVKSTREAGMSREKVGIAGVLAENIALCITNLRLRETLRSQSIRDPLTELYNRRFLDETLAQELARARRANRSVSVIILDADYFKRLNDTWGHDAGDAVLITLARLLQERARSIDVACRMGGEEFALVLPECPYQDALNIAEDIRYRAESLTIQHRGKSLGRVTLSLGVATSPDHASDMNSLVKAADDALYRAKAAGRNRVEGASDIKSER